LDCIKKLSQPVEHFQLSLAWQGACAARPNRASPHHCALADNRIDEKGAIVYALSTRVAPEASKSAGGGRFVSTTRPQAERAGGGGSGAVMA